MESIITSIIILLVLSLISFLVHNNNNKEKKGLKKECIIFKLNKYCKYIALLFMIISAIFLFVVILFNDHSFDFYAMLIISIVSFIFFCFFFLVSVNLKIIYKDGIVVKYTIFGKMKYKFHIKDVVLAQETLKDHIKLVFKNGKNIKVYYQMENYENLKIILHENNIKLEVKRKNF